MNVLVVDDHALFRDGLVGLLSSRPGYSVVGEAGSVREALGKALELRPDLILMDFSLPDGTGLDATQAILLKVPGCKIVFLTASDDDENLLEAIRMGAKGYILKNVPILTLFDNLQALNQDELALSRSMSSRVIQGLMRTNSQIERKSTGLSALSARELEILGELTTGETNEGIAKRLFISGNTVKHHIQSILNKLELSNRHEAAQFARENGLKPR